MKYFNITKEGIVNFYDSNIHNHFDENGNLSAGYIEISDKEYEKLISEDGIKLYRDNKIISYCVPVPNLNLAKAKFNYLTLEHEETASLEEQIEHYKKLIIEKTREIENEKSAGFGNPNLELELNELKKIHLEKSHELALQIENKLK